MNEYCNATLEDNVNIDFSLDKNAEDRPISGVTCYLEGSPSV